MDLICVVSPFFSRWYLVCTFGHPFVRVLSYCARRSGARWMSPGDRGRVTAKEKVRLPISCCGRESMGDRHELTIALHPGTSTPLTFEPLG